jgi:hypothetical protein
MSLLSDIRPRTRLQLLHRLVPIEQRSRLLKRPALGFHREKVYIHQLKREPNSVYEVILPLERIERDGVRVLVEYDRGENTEVHERKTLGAQEERQDFDGVGDEEGRVGDCVEAVEDEDKGEDAVSGVCVAGLGKGRGAGCEQGVADELSGVKIRKGKVR